MTAEEKPAANGDLSAARGRLLEVLEALLRKQSAPRKRKGRKCGSKRKKGRGPCTQPAGWGTTHPGEGRCKLHGGLQPGDLRLKHGLYSTVKTTSVRELYREHAKNPDPLNLEPELAMSRALLELVLSKEAEGIVDVASAAKLVDTVSRVVERIERARNMTALSIQDVYRLMDELGRVVERHIEDQKIRELIRRDWLAIRF